jgi:putative transposase
VRPFPPLAESVRRNEASDANDLRRLRDENQRILRMVAAPGELLRQRPPGEISKTWPRWCSRRAGAVLRMEGWKVNHKRVQRLWREEGLRVPPHSPKRRRLGNSTVPAQRLQAERPNLWALGFMFDTTADGRPFKVLSMGDEFTRESVGGLLGRSITADDVVAELDRLRLQRGGPEYIRCDNGPEFVARAIRDWCRFSGTGTSFIDPGSPWQNPNVESFNGRARDELFAREIFDSILEARVLYEDWRRAYNLHRPHRSLGLQPPAVFAAAFNNQKFSPALD